MLCSVKLVHDQGLRSLTCAALEGYQRLTSQLLEILDAREAEEGERPSSNDEVSNQTELTESPDADQRLEAGFDAYNVSQQLLGTPAQSSCYTEGCIPITLDTAFSMLSCAELGVRIG